MDAPIFNKCGANLRVSYKVCNAFVSFLRKNRGDTGFAVAYLPFYVLIINI